MKVTHLKTFSGYRDLSKHDIKKYLKKAVAEDISIAYTDHAKNARKKHFYD